MTTKRISIISPIDSSIVAERKTASGRQVRDILRKASTARPAWKNTSIAARAGYCHQAIDHLLENKEEIALELTRQMGRPIIYSPGELNGLEERGRYMIDLAQKELEDHYIEPKTGFKRFIRREPLGVVFTIAPWNYPYLTAVNSIIPALMAGNCVILKHSAQTLLCAERFSQAFENAGLPDGVFQHIHLDHAGTAGLIQQNEIQFVSFTGSVPGGEIVEKTACGQFMGVALELGGKDPAYVRHDADLDQAVESIVDGAFFNSGQSCCGIERIYVHHSLYNQFVEGVVETVKGYKLGNPVEPDTTIGPMVNAKSAANVRRQKDQALSLGARTCIDPKLFPKAMVNSPYLEPQVLIDVDHSMEVMKEESFGPVVGIMKVASDEEATALMNDSPYGLTASIWTSDQEIATSLGDRLETGTVFMNRCDYLDPALAWVGVKKSGRGCALSSLGYQQLTRPKSFHLKIK